MEVAELIFLPQESTAFIEHRSLTVPVIKVARHYYDVTTGKTLQTRKQFIESLPHDSYVIQIPYLRPERQSEVEKLLTIFDQNRVTRDAQQMRIHDADYPEAYRQVIRRLQSAVATPEVRRTMEAEDEMQLKRKK